MLDKDLLKSVVNNAIEGTDYFLVDIVIAQNNEITIEVDNTEGVDIDFCVELTHKIESKFDREAEDYSLEVGSAGLTQPFKVLKQYVKNIGNEVEILTKDGRKLHGILISADEDKFVIEMEQKVKKEGEKKKVLVTQQLPFAYDEVKYTKYNIRFK